MKHLTTLVYLCVAGVLVSFAGSIYTGIRIHQEQSKPQPTVFPTPATDASNQGAAFVPSRPAGSLPTPAR